jgi:hypothetical protein
MKKAAIIDPRTPADVTGNLAVMGFEIIPIPLIDHVSEPICGHPDIQIFLHGENAFIHPDASPAFISSIAEYCNVTICGTELRAAYPGDVVYNVLCTGGIAIHRVDSTEPSIRQYFLDNNINLIHTNQGYTRCSTLIVDDKSIITADRSIHKSASAAGLDSLLIEPGYIALPGYDYGFIGGASGRFDNTILLTGRIDHHPDFIRIRDYIEMRGIELKILSENRAIDTGSILILNG